MSARRDGLSSGEADPRGEERTDASDEAIGEGAEEGRADGPNEMHDEGAAEVGADEPNEMPGEGVAEGRADGSDEMSDDGAAARTAARSNDATGESAAEGPTNGPGGMPEEDIAEGGADGSDETSGEDAAARKTATSNDVTGEGAAGVRAGESGELIGEGSVAGRSTAADRAEGDGTGAGRRVTDRPGDGDDRLSGARRDGSVAPRDEGSLGREERLVDGLDERLATHLADGRPGGRPPEPVHALVEDRTMRGDSADLLPSATARAEEEAFLASGAEAARRGRLSPIAERRWRTFRANRRGWYSLWIFLVLFVVTLFAEFVANDRPLLVRYDGGTYFPVFVDYPETAFGGDFETAAEYRDPFVAELIEEKGWMLWPPIRYAHDTVNYDLPVPAPAPPSAENLLGTDDQARDVLARVIYGFRVSVLFGLTLTLASSIVGVAVGAVQGYLGGWTDLIGQRIIEIWAGLPVLYLLIILASIVEPNFWWLLGLMLLFSWMSLVGVVRAEVLRARNLDYVKAAAALGVGRWTILVRHVLPNAMVATLTFLPFILNGSITTLTSLDFLGFGLPPGSASLGELLAQGKQNLQAPWLGITAFVVLAVMLSLLIFIGEAVRDAFDPRKSGR